MTTVDKVHNVFLSFKGRSPRQIYLDATKEFKAKVNSTFADSLSDKVDDFYYLQELNVANNYFGPKGCLAVLKIVQSQQRLRSLDMSGCGLDDIVVAEFVEVMQDHPRLREISLANNPDISVFSGKALSRVARLNVNIIRLDLTNTHVGRNVANALTAACQRNRAAIEVYFSDDYFRMKDMFIGLDVDGGGWVNIKNMVGSVIYPLIQEKLEERIAQTNPKKREDNCIDVTTFMQLTYHNFKDKEEILVRSEESRDAAYDTIVGNWATLLKAFLSAGAVSTHIGRVAHREAALTDKQAAAIVEKAVQLQKAKTEEDGEPAQQPVNVTAPVLLTAIKQCVPPPAKTAAPSTTKRLSFLDKIDKKRWSLPPSMVRAVMAHYEKAPPQGIGAIKILEAKFETDFEHLKTDVLEEAFRRYSVPLELTQITLEEMVNVLDEYYDIIRVPKALSPELVQKIIDA
jgi:hypothetical protein